MRLGSLAVKRVLGKDESPGSNPGLGSSRELTHRTAVTSERAESELLTLLVSASSRSVGASNSVRRPSLRPLVGDTRMPVPVDEPYESGE